MFFQKMLEKRVLAVIVVLLFTALCSAFAAKVKPDFSIELAFPTFDQSRIDYERFKKDFPFEDARGLVVVAANDIFTAAGLARIDALERDLSAMAGVVDTQGLSTVRDLTSDGDTIRMEPLFKAGSTKAEFEQKRKIATEDPLFAWNLSPPNGSATTIAVTLTKEVASKDESRVKFMFALREVVAKHQAFAKASGVDQKITINGLPIVRSAFTEMGTRDLGRLFPLAFTIILGILYATFRSIAEVAAAFLTIVFSVIWTVGVMGVAGVSLHVLTQITPIVVMIICISDTVHVIGDSKALLASGKPLSEAIAHAASESALPCLLTEVTIAGGFIALAANDMVMIQQFGLVTAAGMILTWAANFTVLPLALSFLKPKGERLDEEHPSFVARGISRFIAHIEYVVTHRGRLVLGTTAAIIVVSGVLSTRLGKEYYSYDDLRPNSPLANDLRYVESVYGGTVPMAIFIEPKGPRTADAMIEPPALALIDRITHKLESDFPADVKSAASLSKYLRKAHRLLAGDEMANEAPLPATRRLAAQELLAIDDPRATRDIVSFDRATATVFVMMPDKGSSRATLVLAKLRQYFDEEEKATPYRITTTGIYGIADGIYRNLVGGLAASLAISVLVSFLIFFVVLRSWRLALVGLVPNVLPLLVTVGIMSLLRIDLKPSTVIVFSITLVIADDDTIQYLARFRTRVVELIAEGSGDAHRQAALETLRATGTPMLVTTLSVSVGFLVMMASEFMGLAHLGLLIGVSLFAAVFGDLYISPLILIHLKPAVGRAKAAKASSEVHATKAVS